MNKQYHNKNESQRYIHVYSNNVDRSMNKIINLLSQCANEFNKCLAGDIQCLLRRLMDLYTQYEKDVENYFLYTSEQ